MMRAILSATLGFVLASTNTALACACCADPGYRAESQFKMQDWLAEEIAKVKIHGEAHLYTDACWMDCVHGIDNPQENYEAQLEISDGIWRLNFTSSAAEGGTLRWTTPDNLTFFRVDPAPSGVPGDATLYAEVRMQVDVVGSGAFAPSLMPAELVFTGESNACLDASRLRHWHLSVDTDEARFHFYGKLAMTPQ